MELRYLEQTAETVQQRVNMVNTVIADLTYASMTLEGVEKEKEGSELLVPVGGSSYIKAKLAATDKVIVGMGAGVSVEKTLPEAKELVKNRLADLEKSRMTLQQQFTKIADQINHGREKLNDLVAVLRQGKASEDV
jgi:prefoldin alpha subunit